MTFSEIIRPLDRIDLLISQWQLDVNIQAALTNIINVIDLELISVLNKIEESQSLDTADGWFLDMLGERINVYRYAIDDNTGKFGFDLAGGVNSDGRVGMHGRMHSSNPFLAGASAIGDNYFRRVLKARYRSLSSSATVGDICESLDLLFDTEGLSNCTTTTTNKIQLEIVSADDLFWEAIESDLPTIVGMPLGVSYEVVRRPQIDLFRDAATSPSAFTWVHVANSTPNWFTVGHVQAPDSDFDNITASVETSYASDVEIRLADTGNTQLREIQIRPSITTTRFSYTTNINDMNVVDHGGASAHNIAFSIQDQPTDADDNPITVIPFRFNYPLVVYSNDPSFDAPLWDVMTDYETDDYVRGSGMRAFRAVSDSTGQAPADDETGTYWEEYKAIHMYFLDTQEININRFSNHSITYWVSVYALNIPHSTSGFDFTITGLSSAPDDGVFATNIEYDYSMNEYEDNLPTPLEYVRREWWVSISIEIDDRFTSGQSYDYQLKAELGNYAAYGTFTINVT